MTIIRSIESNTEIVVTARFSNYNILKLFSLPEKWLKNSFWSQSWFTTCIHSSALHCIFCTLSITLMIMLYFLFAFLVNMPKGADFYFGLLGLFFKQLVCLVLQHLCLKFCTALSWWYIYYISTKLFREYLPPGSCEDCWKWVNVERPCQNSWWNKMQVWVIRNACLVLGPEARSESKGNQQRKSMTDKSDSMKNLALRFQAWSIICLFILFCLSYGLLLGSLNQTRSNQPRPLKCSKTSMCLNQ